MARRFQKSVPLAFLMGIRSKVLGVSILRTQNLEPKTQNLKKNEQ